MRRKPDDLPRIPAKKSLLRTMFFSKLQFTASKLEGRVTSRYQIQTNCTAIKRGRRHGREGAARGLQKDVFQRFREGNIEQATMYLDDESRTRTAQKARVVRDVGSVVKDPSRREAVLLVYLPSSQTWLLSNHSLRSSVEIHNEVFRSCCGEIQIMGNSSHNLLIEQ
jgi:hypothetical protein